MMRMPGRVHHREMTFVRRSRLRHLRFRHGEEARQALCDRLTGEPAGDEDEERGLVVFRSRNMHGRVHRMLHAMDDHRIGAGRGSHQALHAQNSVAMPMQQRRQP